MPNTPPQTHEEIKAHFLGLLNQSQKNFQDAAVYHSCCVLEQYHARVGTPEHEEASQKVVEAFKGLLAHNDYLVRAERAYASVTEQIESVQARKDN